MADRTTTTVSLPTPLIFRYHLPLSNILPFPGSTAKLLGDFNVNRRLLIKAHRTGLSNLLWANAKGAPNHPASLGNAHPTKKNP
jgi:hypothetical protein